MTTFPTSSATTYRQALARYQAEPANPAYVRALGWVYADLLKDASGSTDATRMQRGLRVVGAFPMPDADTRWRESVGWSVCRFLLRHKPDTLPYPALAEVVRLAAGFVPTAPCLLRSVWWKALLRHADTGLDWNTLAGQFGWDGGFRPEDELAETFDDNQTARPLLEGLLCAVAKQLLGEVLLSDDTATPWLERLAQATTQHPDWTYLPYYQAQLLLKLNRPAEARRVFLPFARQKPREFWVWGLLAGLVEPEQALVCYARALTLGTPGAFLVKVRQQAAMALLLRGRWADARAEIEQLVQTRQANQWAIPAAVLAWQRDPRYADAQPTAPGAWCEPLRQQADALLWADQPEAVALVTGLDADGHCAYVAIDEQKKARLPLAGLDFVPTVGDRLAIRYELIEKGGKTKLRIRQAQRTDAPLTHLHGQTVTGPLRMLPGKDFGFVKDVYVPADVLAGAGVGADDLVTADAVASWDAVKSRMGWRAFRVTKKAVNLSG